MAGRRLWKRGRGEDVATTITDIENMNLTDFPDANHTFKPPEGTESKVAETRAWVGEVKKDGLDGARIVVVAWKPDENEIRAIMTGAPIYISFAGNLPPHFPTTSFLEASFKG
jgi:hypothetical protein